MISEITSRMTPGITIFDGTFPQLLKDAIDAACSDPSTCTEQEAITSSKTIETGCGELVGASNDTGILNATIAYVTLRNYIPEKNVYCNKDANGGKNCLAKLLYSVLTLLLTHIKSRLTQTVTAGKLCVMS